MYHNKNSKPKNKSIAFIYSIVMNNIRVTNKQIHKNVALKCAGNDSHFFSL